MVSAGFETILEKKNLLLGYNLLCLWKDELREQGRKLSCSVQQDVTTQGLCRHIRRRQHVHICYVSASVLVRGRGIFNVFFDSHLACSSHL